MKMLKTLLYSSLVILLISACSSEDNYERDPLPLEAFTGEYMTEGIVQLVIGNSVAKTTLDPTIVKISLIPNTNKLKIDMGTLDFSVTGSEAKERVYEVETFVVHDKCSFYIEADEFAGIENYVLYGEIDNSYISGEGGLFSLTGSKTNEKGQRIGLMQMEGLVQK